MPTSAATRAWARLIKQVYEVDPLVCPRCGSGMRIIAFIEQPAVIGKILTRLGLCSALSHSKGPALSRSPPLARALDTPPRRGIAGRRGRRERPALSS